MCLCIPGGRQSEAYVKWFLRGEPENNSFCIYAQLTSMFNSASFSCLSCFSPEVMTLNTLRECGGICCYSQNPVAPHYTWMSGSNVFFPHWFPFTLLAGLSCSLCSPASFIRIIVFYIWNEISWNPVWRGRSVTIPILLGGGNQNWGGIVGQEQKVSSIHMSDSYLAEEFWEIWHTVLTHCSLMWNKARRLRN